MICCIPELGWMILPLTAAAPPPHDGAASGGAWLYGSTQVRGGEGDRVRVQEPSTPASFGSEAHTLPPLPPSPTDQIKAPSHAH